MFKSVAAAVLGLSLSLGTWAKNAEPTNELPPEVQQLHWVEKGQGDIANKASITIPEWLCFSGPCRHFYTAAGHGQPAQQ